MADLMERVRTDDRVVDAMRKAMKAGKRNEVLLINNIEDIAPREIRAAFEVLITTVTHVTLEASADKQ